MLKIQQKQVYVLTSKRMASYRERVLDFLNDKIPERCRELGEEQTAEMVDWSIERSRLHGLKTEQHMARFALLTMFFGIDFDMKYDWAVTVLASENTDDERMQAIYEKAKISLEKD